MLIRLKAHSVRGLPRSWSELKISERGLIAHGENGTGKSSLIDALEYVLCGSTSLFAESRLNVDWKHGAPHVIDGEPDISASVKLSNSEFEVSLGADKSGLSSDQRTWLETAETATFVLRRHKLLKFILLEPSKRYELVEPFFNLDKFRTLESHLQQLISSFETDGAEALAKKLEAAKVLERVFGYKSDLLSADALLEKLNASLNSIGASPCKGLDQLDECERTVANFLSGPSGKKLGALANVSSQAAKLASPDPILVLLDSLILAIENVEALKAKRTSEVFTDLLVRAREIIAKLDEGGCPVCEQPIDRDLVLRRLAERINDDREVMDAQVAVNERVKLCLDAVNRTRSDLTRLIADWNEVEGLSALPRSYSDLSVTLEQLQAYLTEAPLLAERGKELGRSLAEIMSSYEPVHFMLETAIQNEGGADRYGKIVSTLMMIEALDKQWGDLNKAARLDAAAKMSRQISERLYGHAVRSRKETVQHIIDEVSDIANSYYEKIHPNESIGKSSLVVREAGQASLNLDALFNGTREPPLLHYSESHLDTLGLCYFLAIRRAEATKFSAFKLLFLDDVLHSVDSAHRGRIVDLLMSEFSDHQLVLTTHDIYFYDILKKKLKGPLTYLRINGWSLSAGPILIDPSTDRERVLNKPIRDALAAETLAASTGRVLEAALKESLEALEIAIPARFSRGYDLGTLWPPFAARLKKQKGFMDANPNLLEDLDRTVWIRNALGGHDNVTSSPVTASEAREFAELVAQLTAAMSCKDCGYPIAKQRGMDDWRCSCGKWGFAKN